MGSTSYGAMTSHVWCNDVENSVDTAALEIACDQPQDLFTSNIALEPWNQKN